MTPPDSAAPDPTPNQPGHPRAPARRVDTPLAVGLALLFALGLLLSLQQQFGWPVALQTLLALLLVCLAVWSLRRFNTEHQRGGSAAALFEQVRRLQCPGLEPELQRLLDQRRHRDDDPFDNLVARSHVIDREQPAAYDEVIGAAARWLATKTQLSASDIQDRILGGADKGATPVTRGVAIPHFRDGDLPQAEVVMIRGRQGITIRYLPIGGDEPVQDVVGAVFVLASPQQDPKRHVHLLAQIARQVEGERFRNSWFSAIDAEELRQVLLHEDHWLSLILHPGARTETLIGKRLDAMTLPDRALVALLHRHGQTQIPNASTQLQSGDRLVVVGDVEAIAATHNMYVGG